MTSPAPGWYPDPAVPTTLRYWDGVAWTPHHRATVSPFDQPETAPPGTSWNTVWIWLVVLMLALPLVSTLFTPWESTFDYDLGDPTAAQRAQWRMLTDPLQLPGQLLGYLTYGLAVLFAFLDHRELSRRQVPRPFHWAWAFLTPVYPIGRSVVVVRRTGHGWAPMWATIAALVLALVVVGMVVLVLLTAMADLWIGTY